MARIVQLLGRSKSATPLTSATVDGVILEDIDTGDIVQLGPHLLVLQAWKELGFTPMLEEMGLNASQIAAAQLMIANRLIKPLSEWALIDWAQRTALPELLDVRLTKTSKDRLYHTSDALLANRKSIEAKLRQREADLFSLSRSVVLYDVTDTHFEGLCKKNPKARHGKNKQKRIDCRQVAVGMAFDEHGLPLAHEVFEGNIADTKTLEVMLDRLKIPDAGLKPVVILDAGFASAANIAMLKERGYSYLINITRGSRTKYAKSFENEIFEQLPGREIDQKVEVIERKIASLQKKHPRVARLYTLSYRDGQLTAVRDEEKMQSALAPCGDYVLKTDKTLDAPQLWFLYMTLLKAEEGFCMLKGSLGLRPNYHQLEGRVDGHIFISVLAYHMLSWVRQKLESHGDMRDWTTVRRLLGTHSLVSTLVPLADGRLIQVRKVSVPDAE